MPINLRKRKFWEHKTSLAAKREKGGGEDMGLEIASLAFSAFAFGFTLCNGIWVFFGPSAQEKRERRKCERSKGDQDGND